MLFSTSRRIPSAPYIMNLRMDLTVDNGVLNHVRRFAAEPDATMSLTKPTLTRIQLGQISLDDAIAAGDVRVDGGKESIGEFFGMLDTFDFWFNIVTP